MYKLHVPGIRSCVALPSASDGFMVMFPNPSWLTSTTFFPTSSDSVPASFKVNDTSTASTRARERSVLTLESLSIVIGIRSDSVTPSPLSIGATTTM